MIPSLLGPLTGSENAGPNEKYNFYRASKRYSTLFEEASTWVRHAMYS